MCAHMHTCVHIVCPSMQVMQTIVADFNVNKCQAFLPDQLGHLLNDHLVLNISSRWVWTKTK